MRFRMTSDEWSESFDPGEGYCADVECEEAERPTHYNVLGPDGQPIPLPTVRFGFWPSR